MKADQFIKNKFQFIKGKSKLINIECEHMLYNQLMVGYGPHSPNPVFLPRESEGRGSPMGCHLWGHTESDTTEVT